MKLLKISMFGRQKLAGHSEKLWNRGTCVFNTGWLCTCTRDFPTKNFERWPHLQFRWVNFPPSSKKVIFIMQCFRPFGMEFYQGTTFVYWQHHSICQLMISSHHCSGQISQEFNYKSLTIFCGSWNFLHSRIWESLSNCWPYNT